MTSQPEIGQDREDDAGTKRAPGANTGATSVRNRWIIAGVVVLALVVTVVAVGVINARRTNTRRADDLAKQGSTAFSQGNFAGAEAALAQVVALHSSDATAQALLGRSLEAQGDLAGAAKAYSASIDANAKQPDVLCRLAVIQKSEGKNAEAIATLKKALSVNPQFFAAHLLLSQLYVTTGAVADARGELDVVIKLHPTGVDVKALKKRRDALK